MLDLLIVGAGPVGLYSAFSAGAKKLNTLVIESLDYVGGQLTTLYPEKPIYDFPGIKEIKAKDLIKELYNQYLPFEKEVPIKLGVSLINIEMCENYYKVFTSEAIYETKTILLTTGNGGFTPRPLELENAALIKNLSYNLVNIDKYKEKEVVILGGGDSALDYGNMLKGVAKKVNLVHRRNEFRALEDSIEKFKTHGFIYTPYTPNKLNINNNLGTSIELKNAQTEELLTLNFDELIVSFGMLPSTFDYNACGIHSTKDGINVKTNMETSLPGVFACGNCINYLGKIKTIACGIGEAAIAMHSIESIIYPKKSSTPGYFHPTK
jgi:thioredoxin reductase (NADPH)